jgi:hypothetical protein
MGVDDRPTPVVPVRPFLGVAMSRAVTLLVLAAVLPAAGCALLAKKTPTPAAQLDEKEMARVPPTPGERYYVLFFGSQDRTRRPAFTHTWATLVRAVEVPGCEPALDVHTISWLPTKLDIDALSTRVEPGTNVGLHETIANSLRTKQDIAVWGPYEVWHGFAHRFRVQKAFLDSGAVGYQCVDVIGEAARQGNGCDCIHAITDMDPVYPRSRYPLAFYGQPATANLVRRVMHSPVIIDPPRTHDWLIPRLGLNAYPIEVREYRGRVEGHTPGAPGLQAVPAVPLPGAPVVPKDPTPKTAPTGKPAAPKPAGPEPDE